MRLRHATLAALSAAALAVAACGGDDDPKPAADTTAQTQSQPATEQAESTSPDQIAADVPKQPRKRPELPKPGGTPPTELQTLDVVKGKGKRARKGDKVTVDYVGANWSNGAEFDASWNAGQPFEFSLGAGQVIPGWDQGVAGMKVGGRRLLVIPPDLGYGPQGSPPSIPPNETLMFVVDLRKVK